jgi:hypothetical protein
MIRKLRFEFWRALAGITGVVYRFCRQRQARCCNCDSCHVISKSDRIVRRMIQDIAREEMGLPKIDRRPS